MNDHIKKHLNGLVDDWCIKHKQPIFGFDQHHQCNSECQILGKFPFYICVKSRQVHECGRGKCQHPYKTLEGTFCKLTGFELYGPEAETSSLVVRDSCGRSTRHWGDRIRCGKKKKGKQKKTETVLSMNFFLKAVEHFLISSERKKIYRQEMDKFRNAIEKIAKKPGNGILSVEMASRLVSDTVEKHVPLCVPPPCAKARWIEPLAKHIFQFWKQLNFACTRKSVSALVAVSLSFMAKRKGYVSDGVVYIHYSPIVAQHIVTDMQFGKFTGLTCRRMSIVQRNLMKKLLTPSGKQKIIVPLKFSAE